MPGSNPLRSLGEMAGKVSSDYRPTVMDLLRDALQTELAQRKVRSTFPEAVDARLGAFSANPQGAAQTARDGNLSGLIFVGEIWRWEGEPQKFLRVLAEFKLIRIADGAVLWGDARSTRRSHDQRYQSRSSLYGCRQSGCA